MGAGGRIEGGASEMTTGKSRVEYLARALHNTQMPSRERIEGERCWPEVDREHKGDAHRSNRGWRQNSDRGRQVVSRARARRKPCKDQADTRDL